MTMANAGSLVCACQMQLVFSAFVAAFLAPTVSDAFSVTLPPLRGGIRSMSIDLKAHPTLENFGLQRIDPDGSVLGLTENNALTYKKTGSKCLDLFNDVLPGTTRKSLTSYLDAAWSEDALVTLKLIFQLGDPRNGKSDRLNLHQALLWLYENHFETLMLNLHQLGRFSYHKSMLELLVLVVEGPDALDDKRPRAKGLLRTSFERSERRKETRWRNVVQFYKSRPELAEDEWKDGLPAASGDSLPIGDPTCYRDGFYGPWVSDDLREKFVQFIHEQDQEESKRARFARAEKKQRMLQKAEDLYRSDSKFCGLYDKVADHFAEGLKEEKRRMENGEKDFGLVAKWAPSTKGCHDRRTNICEGIIQRLYCDRYKYRDPELRVLYQTKFLAPLRRAAEIPESFTGSGEWSLVNYQRMPSRCRMLYGEMFRRHDTRRYDTFIDEAKKQAESGERINMISAGALLPHQITGRATRSDSKLNDELGLQWLRLIQDVKDNGKLPNALAICDVSGSMFSAIPGGNRAVDVSAALSMLVADVTEGFYSNGVITFSENPEFVKIPKATTDNLSSRVAFMKGMNWGYNTNFQAVFDLILEAAKEDGLDSSKMPSILFCFSDMEFDQAHEGNWKTDLELIRSKYARAGYEVPTIVFWNLRGSGSKAASFEEPGVVMLSGFGSGMLKAFLDFRLGDIRSPTPTEAMMAALTYYDDLVLADEDSAGQVGATP